MNRDFVKGIIPPIVTPVRPDESIDIDKLNEQIDWMADRGISGVLLFGSNSEFYVFEADEMLEVAEKVVKHVNHRIPVFFGIGAIRTSKCVYLAKGAVKAGVDAVSIL
ncbi:MAG TPA: dihydrodipicolinate synthase family protein, partial [Sphaerochaeta sp.]|nr:dihydrodipicolinate synthase family protein [Sphaerochaeta sp.]